MKNEQDVERYSRVNEFSRLRRQPLHKHGGIKHPDPCSGRLFCPLFSPSSQTSYNRKIAPNLYVLRLNSELRLFLLLENRFKEQRFKLFLNICIVAAAHLAKF